eukprot:TRINITY_DN4509_c0_g2_i13.p2 TRINITY_DN4509_c0_g2~~TRINITY_DN4509_c0_g2_i13.p2  ORF type:complete len:204 (+),score=39.73 TRINITY_DN4509_c0_g2_i13:123-734(+)
MHALEKSVKRREKNDISVASLTDPLFSGWIYKRSGNVHSWKRRWMVLKDSALYYFLKPTSTKLKGIVMLNDFCWVSEEARVVSKKLSSYLLLVCPGRTYVMNFDSEDDLVGWYNILKQTLENIAKNEQKNVPPLTTGFNDSWESSDSPRSKQWYQRRVRELGSEKVGKVGCVSRVEAVIEICVVSAVVQTVEIENRVGIQIRF